MKNRTLHSGIDCRLYVCAEKEGLRHYKFRIFCCIEKSTNYLQLQTIIATDDVITDEINDDNM